MGCDHCMHVFIDIIQASNSNGSIQSKNIKYHIWMTLNKTSQWIRSQRVLEKWKYRKWRPLGNGVMWAWAIREPSHYCQLSCPHLREWWLILVVASSFLVVFLTEERAWLVHCAFSPIELVRLCLKPCWVIDTGNSPVFLDQISSLYRRWAYVFS